MSSPASAPGPRLLKSTYLADGEILLKETRSTALYYFPGPVLALLILSFLDYAALTVRDGSLPHVPYLTDAFGGLPTVSGTGPGNYVLGLFFLLTILGLLVLLVRYLRWISTIYAVSSTRVIIQRGLISRDFDEIPVGQVRGVDVHQTGLQRLFGFGTIQVSSEGGHSLGNESWRGIPRPFDFQRLVEGATANLRAPASGAWSGPPPPAPPPGYLRPPGQR
ncbi:MAG TPA: PH domain-containing protein [Thermoplasmata archaeon]|nr:PH domain-containing protein [Thermoplasmata archaeon]